MYLPNFERVVKTNSFSILGISSQGTILFDTGEFSKYPSLVGSKYFGLVIKWGCVSSTLIEKGGYVFSIIIQLLVKGKIIQEEV